MTRVLLVFTLLLSPAGWLVAQDQTAAPYTPLEQERIRNANLLVQLRDALREADTCRGQLAEPRAAMNTQQIQTAIDTLKRELEAARPGYAWDASTGQFTKKPERSEAPANDRETR